MWAIGWLVTTKRHVTFESWCGLDYLIAFDFDPNIVGIAGQPFRFEFAMTGGSFRSHMPDYFLRAADGDGIVVDIEPDELIDANDRINFAASAALCDAVGWTYRRLGGLPDVMSANLRWLAGYRHGRISDHAIGARVRQVVQHSPGLSLRRLAGKVGEPILSLPTIFHMLWRQELVTELSRLTLSRSCRGSPKLGGVKWGYSGMMSCFWASRLSAPGAPAGTAGRRGATAATGRSRERSRPPASGSPWFSRTDIARSSEPTPHEAPYAVPPRWRHGIQLLNGWQTASVRKCSESVEAGARRLGRRAPVPMPVIAATSVRYRRSVVGREAYLPEHPAHVDDHLSVDVFARRCLEDFNFWTQRHREFGVALFGSRCEALEQRQDFTPFNVAARGMAEDFLDRVAVTATEVRVHEQTSRDGCDALHRVTSGSPQAEPQGAPLTVSSCNHVGADVVSGQAPRR